MKCRFCDQEISAPVCPNCGYENQKAVTSANEPASWHVGLFAILLYLAIPAGILLFIALLFKGFDWFADHVFPVTSTLSGVSFLLIVPLSLIFAIFRRFRGRAGFGLMIYSYIAGMDLWVRALALTYATTGLIGVIGGVLLAGIGVVPIAMGAMIYRAQWSVLIYLAVALVLVFVFRFFGGFLMAKAE